MVPDIREGLRGTAIPIPGRVMAVVDVYDAITTRKLYQTPMSNDEAVAHIVESKGSHFDPGGGRRVRQSRAHAASALAAARGLGGFRSSFRARTGTRRNGTV